MTHEDLLSKHRAFRKYVRTCGYIGPIFKTMSEIGRIKEADLMLLLQGAESNVDDYDNGELPVFLDMNLNNEGEATFHLFNEVGIYGVRQRDGLTRTDKLCALWGNLNVPDSTTGKRNVCDAWHAGNPAGRRNFVEFLATLGLDVLMEYHVPTSTVILTEGEKIHSPLNTVIVKKKYVQPDGTTDPVGYMNSVQALPGREFKLIPRFQEN